MVPRCLVFASTALLLATMAATAGDELSPVSERAKRVHAAALLVDGHNDLPFRLRDNDDVTFTKIDISRPLGSGRTDIPRLRQGGVDAQFWSVFVESDDPSPARSVTQQIDLVYRMAERYADTFEMAFSADDVERIASAGKIACLIGIEGGVAIENNLAQLRAFARLGARYMTLTHNTTLAWADAATDEPRSDGLSSFGERVVLEMNRLGMLVDISHVSAATMADALRVSRAPIIASHSSAFAICPERRNVPDEILVQIKTNRGVVMVNFFSLHLVPGATKIVSAKRAALRAKYPQAQDFRKALDDWLLSDEAPRGSVSDVADHIDHIIKVAGIDHVGLGADYDGVDILPRGLSDVSCYPHLTEELLRRGHSESDVHKILGGNILRVLREACLVGEQLRKTTPPDVDEIKVEPAK